MLTVNGRRILYGRKGGRAMNSAQVWKLKFFSCVAVLFLALTMLPCFSESTAAPVIDFKLEATGTEMTEPGIIHVSAIVSNTGSADMTEPVTLRDPEGNIVSEFGENGSALIKAGEKAVWEGEYSVSEEELNKGRITFGISYHEADQSGLVFEVTQEAQLELTYKGEHANLSIIRTVTPEVARAGKTVSAVYELDNTGNVEISSVRISEKLTGKVQSVNKLAPGEKKTVTFSAQMGAADLISGSTVAYNVAGESEARKEVFEDVTVPHASPNLSISLEAATPSINIGEAAVLRMTFTNAGNVSYSGVTVRDEKFGEMFTGLEIPANTTVTEETSVILREPATMKFTATLPDNTGETHELTTETVSVQVYDPQNTLRLSLDLTCDHETIATQPAVVRFSLQITNNSDVTATDIAIRHGSVDIYTIASLAAGKTVRLDRDVEVSQAGKFQFTASAKDSMGNTVAFESNVFQLMYAAPTAQPTAVPIPTVAPLVTLPPVEEKDADPVMRNARDISQILTMVLIALFLVSFILLIAAAVVRSRKRRHSEGAYDHLELSEKRDYEDTASDKEYGTETVKTAEKETEPAEKREDTVRDSEEEKASDPLEEGAPEPEVTVDDVVSAKIAERDYQEDPYQEEGFRVTRSSSFYTPDAGKQAEAPETQVHTRSRRANKN